MKDDDINRFRDAVKGKGPENILECFLNEFGDDIILSSSLGAEDQVLTDMLLKIDANAKILTLDTGRLPQETYDLIDSNMKRYQMKFQIMFPETAEVEAMEREYGTNLFYESIDKRKQCCGLRKIKPLKRALVGKKAWITGIRREQSITRTGVEIVEWDDAFGLLKINPLADWSEEQVWDYIKKNEIPYNKLHDRNYPSIGCAPCTRPIKTGEDVRAGRWWWEIPGHKECGLHVKDGKLAGCENE